MSDPGNPVPDSELPPQQGDIAAAEFSDPTASDYSETSWPSPPPEPPTEALAAPTEAISTPTTRVPEMPPPAGAGGLSAPGPQAVYPPPPQAPPAYGSQSPYANPPGYPPPAAYGNAPAYGSPYPQPGQPAANPYGGSPYAPPQYYQPPGAATTNGSAIALTIVSGFTLLFCGNVLGIPALVLGIRAWADQSSNPVRSRKHSRWGWIAFAVGMVLNLIIGIALLAAWGSSA